MPAIVYGTDTTKVYASYPDVVRTRMDGHRITQNFGGRLRVQVDNDQAPELVPWSTSSYTNMLKHGH